MKKTCKILSLILAVLFVVTCFAACGGKPADSTNPDSQKPQATETEDERQSVKDGVPTDLNYASASDHTVTFFQRTQYPYEIECDELVNDVLSDAIHYRNIDVENRLGVQIDTIQQSCSYNEHTAWNSVLSTSVLTNSGDFDAAAIYTSTGTKLAKEGVYLNLLSLLQEDDNGYFDFSKPWWNQSLLDELNLYDTLFYCGGDIASSETEMGLCLFFNKGLFDQKFPEEKYSNLYQLVRDKQWTISAMIDYVDASWEDLNSNGIIDAGDIAGVVCPAYGTASGGMDAWLYAMGLDVIEKDEFGDPVITVHNNPNVAPAYELVRKLYVETAGSMPNAGGAETKFANNNLLFHLGYLRSGGQFRELTFDYGVLPMPMYNEEQGEYRSVPESTCSLFTILSNVPREKAVMISALFELLAAESYKQVTPAYYSTVLQGQYSREQADAEMYDTILSTLVIPFSHIYSQSLGVITHIFRNMDPTFDMQSKLDSSKSSWQTKLDELLTALESVE